MHIPFKDFQIRFGTFFLHSKHANKTIDANGQGPSNAPGLIECEWCPELFVNISKAILHKFRKHKGEERNYHCEHCGKLFPLRCALDQHVRSEHNEATATTSGTSSGGAGATTADAKYDCYFCSAPFVSERAKDFHERNAHRMEYRQLVGPALPPPSKKVKINQSGDAISLYYCHLCGSEYMLKFNLQQHLERGHRPEEVHIKPPEDVIQCKACEAIFYNRRAYDVHNLTHKPDDLYVISEEQR